MIAARSAEPRRWYATVTFSASPWCLSTAFSNVGLPPS